MHSVLPLAAPITVGLSAILVVASGPGVDASHGISLQLYIDPETPRMYEDY